MIGRRDDDLTARAKAGDADAWRALYQANHGRLVQWLEAVPYADAAVDAGDIAATAWLTASRRIDGFTGSSSDFAGWLFTIARNVARTTRATGVRRATFPSDTQTADPAVWGVVDDPGSDVDAADLASRLIRQLSPREAEAVACIDVVGFDIATTAKVLGVSEVAVRVAHHRGIGHLRRMLVADDAATATDVALPAAWRRRPHPGVSS